MDCCVQKMEIPRRKEAYGASLVGGWIFSGTTQCPKVILLLYNYTT